MMTRIAQALGAVVLLSLLLPVAAFAQRVSFDITFEKRTPSATTRFLFTFAADPLGTDDVDTALGEREIPPIPLPGDIFYVWTIAPTTEVIWLSPMDVREYSVGEALLVVYDVRVNWTGGTLELFWPRPLPTQIDSIWITDGYSDFPDNFVMQKVEPGARLSTTNPAIDRFKVLIWYNGTATSVGEFEDAVIAGARVFPNPTANTLHLADLPSTSREVRIVNAMGQLLGSYDVSTPTLSIDVSTLSQGQYTIIILDESGIHSTQQFIRQ